MALFHHFQNNALRCIVRLTGNRHLVWHNRPILAEELARKCRMHYAETITRETDEGEKVYRIEYGVLDVRLIERPGARPGERLGEWLGERLRLVVVKGFGEKPMLRLTNLTLTDSRVSLWQVVEGYL